VVLVAPAWVTYHSQVTLTGKKSIVIQTTYEDGWKLTPHSLAQVNMLEYWLNCFYHQACSYMFNESEFLLNNSFCCVG